MYLLKSGGVGAETARQTTCHHVLNLIFGQRTNGGGGGGGGGCR